MSKPNEKVVTRFAPSPTGFLHVGGVRTALFAFLYARKHAGEFILRIEDTDKAREVDGSIEHIIESLQWLGLDWDYGPHKASESFGSTRQSERLAIYKTYAEKLVEKGLAYPDPYSAEEIAVFRAEAEAEKRPFLYRRHRPETFSEWDGTRPLRFKVPDVKRYQWHDIVRGDLSGGEEMLDDMIIMKADGFPTYNFAHIVDDHEMGVTHVMRGEEFIASMPKFLSLYDALEIDQPQFATLPPIMGPDGKKKLSKRDGAKDLLDYRTDGYLPEAMQNFLALIGWNPGTDQEIFTLEDLVDQFSLEKVQKSGGAFNEEKLRWIQKEKLGQMSEEEKAAYVIGALPEYDSEKVAKLAPTILEQLFTQADINAAAQAGEFDWAFGDITYATELLQWKKDNSVDDALPRLTKTMELLQDADFNSVAAITDALWPYANEIGKGEVLWPLRVSLTGRDKSPSPFVCAWVLGEEETIARIRAACDKISK